jgi:hypothetical protein
VRNVLLTGQRRSSRRHFGSDTAGLTVDRTGYRDFRNERKSHLHFGVRESRHLADRSCIRLASKHSGKKVAVELSKRLNTGKKKEALLSAEREVRPRSKHARKSRDGLNLQSAQVIRLGLLESLAMVGIRSEGVRTNGGRTRRSVQLTSQHGRVANFPVEGQLSGSNY